MSINEISIMLFIVIVFAISLFFSFVRWLEKHIEEITKDNWIKALVRGASHATVGAGVGIVSLIALQEFYPDISRLMGAGVSIIVAIIVDSILFGLEEKAKR